MSDQLKQDLREKVPKNKRNRFILQLFFFSGIPAALEVTRLFQEIDEEDKINAEN